MASLATPAFARHPVEYSSTGYDRRMELRGSRRAERRRNAGPRKGDIREGQILDATERLLVDTPFAKFTMQDIARQAGLSRSALYFYFASKDDVLRALLERTHAVMMRPTAVLAAADTPLDDAIREMLEQSIHNWRKHGPALRTFVEAAAASSEFAEEWRAALEENVAIITALIERERDAGRAAPAPPAAESVAWALLWMSERMTSELFRRRHTRAEEREVVDTLTVLWQRCMGAS
jgi:AcrR family transcriptional regulator